ncbi:hypothetical protein DEAC_c20890 [Desulfosporosinus acididurans]|uniref:Uncharacterized protein n=1 Tax=Desulfosporosinus acididurans TaxID=476652 RepID=A0A0J1FRE9_9FIRM|nr:hypothetical protein DEAC_c20890 [Desulfosporosinus acididurans]
MTIVGIPEFLTILAATDIALNAKLLPKNAGSKTRKVIYLMFPHIHCIVPGGGLSLLSKVK